MLVWRGGSGGRGGGGGQLSVSYGHADTSIRTKLHGRNVVRIRSNQIF